MLLRSLRANETGCGISGSGNQIELTAVTLGSMERCLIIFQNGDPPGFFDTWAEEQWIP